MFKVLGVTDERSSCDCCGRDGLKKVVAIQNVETGAVGYYGTTCALSPAKCFGITKEDIAIATQQKKKEQHLAYVESVKNRIEIKKVLRAEQRFWYVIYLDCVEQERFAIHDDAKEFKRTMVKDMTKTRK